MSASSILYSALCQLVYVSFNIFFEAALGFFSFWHVQAKHGRCPLRRGMRRVWPQRLELPKGFRQIACHMICPREEGQVYCGAVSRPGVGVSQVLWLSMFQWAAVLLNYSQVNYPKNDWYVFIADIVSINNKPNSQISLTCNRLGF